MRGQAWAGSAQAVGAGPKGAGLCPARCVGFKGCAIGGVKIKFPSPSSACSVVGPPWKLFFLAQARRRECR